MGQKSNNLGDGELETGASERMCLQAKKREPRFYVIKSKWTLTVLTRVVFLILTLFSAAVITTSIWLMLDCRESFATVRPLLPRNIQFCTNMGMPALFACCTMLFAIFGLGCTGRRLTGYALIIISSVEILQSVTALTFYKCNTMSRHEVMASVNSSLLPCYTPNKYVIPFMSSNSPDNSAFLPRGSSFAGFHRSARTSGTGRSSVERPIVDAEDSVSSQFNQFKINDVYRTSLQSPSFMTTSYIHNDKKKRLQHLDITVPLDTSHARQTVNASPQLNKQEIIKRMTQHVDCTPGNRYFWNLSQRLKKSEVNSCIHVCKAYQAVCPVSNKHMQFSAQVPPSDYIPQTGTSLRDDDTITSWSRDRGTGNRNYIINLSGVGNVKGFERMAEECGYKVYKYVSDLCYYDTKVILPISLCAPLICIGMSVCFIYLAYCDRRLKEESQSNIFIQVPEESSSPSCTWSFGDCCSRLINCLKPCRCNCPINRSLTWTCLVCCRCCPFAAGHLDSCERSNSTNELLHLQAMPSSLTIASALSPAVSQYTINTSFSDDCSPILPRRS